MRISDWSSDVCSSDLLGRATQVAGRDPARDPHRRHASGDCMTPIRIAIRRLPHGDGLPLPAYATDGAAGMDVVAAEDIALAPGARHAVATGFAIALPAGYEVQVRPRSGRSEEHTSELQSPMRLSYAVLSLK